MYFDKVATHDINPLHPRLIQLILDENFLRKPNYRLKAQLLIDRCARVVDDRTEKER